MADEREVPPEEEAQQGPLTKPDREDGQGRPDNEEQLGHQSESRQETLERGDGQPGQGQDWKSGLSIGAAVAPAVVGGALGAGFVGALGAGILGYMGVSGLVKRRVPSRPHPTGIASTAASGTLKFGSDYTHTLTSSSGRSSDLKGMKISEEVKVGRDDFGIGTAVPLGKVIFTCDSRGRFTDRIQTPWNAVWRAMQSRVCRLPAILDTPQTLHWRDVRGRWRKFASVAVRFLVRRRKRGRRRLEAVTIDNAKSVVEGYYGPGPGGCGGRRP